MYKTKYEDTVKIIYALKVGIRKIYENMGCGNDKVEDPEMITESNMLAYLSAIEERTNEIFQMYDLCTKDVTQFDKRVGIRTAEEREDGNTIK